MAHHGRRRAKNTEEPRNRDHIALALNLNLLQKTLIFNPLPIGQRLRDLKSKHAFDMLFGSSSVAWNREVATHAGASGFFPLDHTPPIEHAG